LITLILLTIYEVTKVLLDGILFVSETMVDKIWDLIVGMIGFFITYTVFKKQLK